MKKIIYDLGANEGKSIGYYLLKADLVIAVEANSELCSFIKKKYNNEILNNRLIVENSIVTNKASSFESFYISKIRSYFSTYVSEEKRKKQYWNGKLVDKNDWEEKLVKSINIIELFQKYGKPHYVKIDLENFDQIILNEILNNDQFKPKFISSECQDIEVYNLFIKSKDYTFFKYVLGASVIQDYNDLKFIDLKNEEQNFSFTEHSSGPYGDDVNGEWLNRTDFHKEFLGLMSKKLAPGWIDIHSKLLD